MTDPFRHDDAAYVLGALAPDERAAFETHLETCDECRARVAEARATAGLLAGLPLADVDVDAADPGPVPDTLLPGLLRRADSERARRRWLTGSLAAVAAACAVALIVLIWPSGSTSSAPALAFHELRGPSPVSATATLVAKPWGTEIELHCHYVDEIEHGLPYRLIVIDKSHVQHDAGSWTLVPDEEVSFTSGTAVPKSDIDLVQITLPDGSPILQLNL